MTKLLIRSSVRWPAMIILATMSLGAAPDRSFANDTATVIVSTNTGNDTLVKDISGSVVIRVDSGPDTVAWVTLFLQWDFSNGNVVGPLTQSGTNPNVVFSNVSQSIFEFLLWNSILGYTASDPDTTLGGTLTFRAAPPFWAGAHELMRLVFAPTDTGRIVIRGIEPDGGPPDPTCSVGRHDGTELALRWTSPVITVVSCADASITSGDTNFDRAVTSADVIYLVNYVFKSGLEPVLWNLGDTNGDGKITSADIVTLVNYVFKSGAPPCDVCSTL